MPPTPTDPPPLPAPVDPIPLPTWAEVEARARTAAHAEGIRTVREDLATIAAEARAHTPAVATGLTLTGLLIAITWRAGAPADVVVLGDLTMLLLTAAHITLSERTHRELDR